MSTPEDYNDLDRYQDELGQLPQLQSYSQALYFFKHKEGVSRDDIVASLSRAVEQVRAKVPWMGARVVCVGASPGRSGRYRVVPVAPPEPPIDVADLSSVFPPYEEVVRRKAPLSVLVANAGLLSPVPGYPRRFELDRDDDPAHCIRLQVSFIDGGVLLSFSIMHTTADAGGYFGLINMVATGMRGEALSPSLLAVVNRDRRGAVPLLGVADDDPPPMDHSQHLRRPVTPWDPLVPSQAARNHIFRFSPAAMAAIKELAGKPGADGWDPEVAFVSTDDALCAFCWQRLAAARLRRPEGGSRPPAGARSRFTRQMDGRKLVGLPPDYPAVVSHTVGATLTLAEAAGGLGLPAVACALRRALNAANTARHLRSMATFIDATADRSAITYAGDFDPDRDVGSSSMRSFPSAFPDFGPLLGTPDFMRRPPSVAFPGTVVFFPSTEGNCDANACLTDADFATLMADPEWTKYVEHIG